MTQFLDFLEGASCTQKLKPTLCSTAQTSAVIDFNLYVGRVAIVVNSTKGTDDNEVLTPTLVTDDESDGAFATLHATLDTILGGATPGAADKAVWVVVAASAPKRYGKVVLTPTGTTPAFVADVLVVGTLR